MKVFLVLVKCHFTTAHIARMSVAICLANAFAASWGRTIFFNSPNKIIIACFARATPTNFRFFLSLSSRKERTRQYFRQIVLASNNKRSVVLAALFGHFIWQRLYFVCSCMLWLNDSVRNRLSLFILHSRLCVCALRSTNEQRATPQRRHIKSNCWKI